MRKRVTRTIVIEGPEEWVDTTLVHAQFPNAGDDSSKFFGSEDRIVSCTSRTDEIIKEDE